MSTTIFETLTPRKQGYVQAAFEHECPGCAVFLGETLLGEYTIFWHYGQSSDYVSLPLVRGMASPQYDFDSGHILVGDREFTTEGKEVLPPPFEYLVHVDLRLYNELYIQRKNGEGFESEEDETNFLICCGGGSTLPRRSAKVLGVDPQTSLPWIANYWLKPWELTEDLFRAAVALSIVYPDDRREVIL